MHARQQSFESGRKMNLSNAVPAPDIAGPSTSYTASSGAPPPPPGPPPAVSPQTSTQLTPYGMSNYGGYGMGMGGMGMGNYGMNGLGGYGGIGYGAGAYGGFMGGMAPYGGYNQFGGPDLESRFIQMAVESSRPAFESIGGVVQAVSSVAMMLDNTYIALTSSFRAILGVAENFGRLRSVFSQVWSSLIIFRSLNWLVRKLLVMLGLRTESEFKAWAAAVAESQCPELNGQKRSASSWPVLLFIGVLASAPYVILRLMRGVSATLAEKLSEPQTWTEPLRAIAQYDYQGSSARELSFRAEQLILVAPQHLQGKLWDSGWLVGTIDRKTVGFVPVGYIKVIRPKPAHADVGEERPGVVNNSPSFVTSNPGVGNSNPGNGTNNPNVINNNPSFGNDNSNVINNNASVKHNNVTIDKNNPSVVNDKVNDVDVVSNVVNATARVVNERVCAVNDEVKIVNDGAYIANSGVINDTTVKNETGVTVSHENPILTDKNINKIYDEC